MTFCNIRQEKTPRFTVKLRFLALRLVLPLVLIVLLSANYGNYRDSTEVSSYSNTTSDDDLVGQITKSQTQTHDTITITGNADFIAQATNEGWSGDGSSTNPYLIDGLDIDTTDTSAINIRNVDLHFKITNCLLTAEDYGIHFENVTNAQLTNNTIQDNHYGIFLEESSNNSLCNSTIQNNWYGIFLEYSSNNSLYNNTVQNNDNYGIHLEYSSNNSLYNNVIQNNVEYGIDLWYSSDNNLIYNNTIQNHYAGGIYLGGCSNNSLFGNTIQNSGEGAILSSSNYNCLWNNTIQNNWHGGILLGGSNNNLYGNTIQSNYEYGIYLVNSGNNSLYNNMLIDNGLVVDTSLSVNDWLQNEVVNNTVNGKPLIYWKNVINKTVPQGAGQVILVNCSSIIVSGQNLSAASRGLMVAFSQSLDIHNNTIRNNGYGGIYLWESNDNNFCDNVIQNNTDYGIYLWKSNDNNFCDNVIQDNTDYGIYLLSSSNNSIISNNFTSNNFGGGSQAYDSENSGTNNIFSYNYWSDWTNPDSNNDGIVDNPYPIGGNENNEDLYPITSHWSGHTLSVLTILEPAGGETINGTVRIRWTAVNDSLGHAVSYTIYYSPDGGNNWFELVTGLGQTYWDWNTSTVTNGDNYFIKVKAICVEDPTITVEGISNGSFIINNQEQTTTTNTNTTANPSNTTSLADVITIPIANVSTPGFALITLIGSITAIALTRFKQKKRNRRLTE